MSPGDRVFVPVRDLPQVLAGDVQVPQPGDAAAQQNPVNRGRGQDDPELGQLGDQHHRAEFHAPAEPLHQVLDLWVRLLRRPTRTRRPVVQAVIAVLHPAGVPFRERLPGHPGLRGDMTDRAASIDPLTQPPTAFRGQRVPLCLSSTRFFPSAGRELFSAARRCQCRSSSGDPPAWPEDPAPGAPH